MTNPNIKRKIVLSDENFKTLISGGIVDKDETQIILNDIGYPIMIKMITDAWDIT